MKLVDVSTDDAYGRKVLVKAGTGKCSYCLTVKDILSVDNSDEEYLSFNCCEKCFSNLLNLKEWESE